MKVLPLREAYDFGNAKGLKDDIDQIQNIQITWDRSYKSTVRRGKVIKLFQQHNILNEFIEKVWPEANSQKGQTYINRCIRIANEFDQYQNKSPAPQPKEEKGTSPDSDIEHPAEFALESHLAEFIGNNWNKVFGMQLRIYRDEQGRDGKEYDTKEIGKIDFLCQDDNNDFVVIELKKGRATDRVLGQIQRYMGWVLENLAQGHEVRGLIITPTSEDEQLRYALKVAKYIQWKCYKLDFSLVSPEGL